MLEGRLPRTRSGLTSQFVCVDHLKIVGEALAGVVPRHALHGHREGGAPLEQLGMRRSGRRVGRVRHRPRQRHVQLPAWAKVPRARAHARRVARCHRPRHCAAREVVLIASDGDRDSLMRRQVVRACDERRLRACRNHRQRARAPPSAPHGHQRRQKSKECEHMITAFR